MTNTKKNSFNFQTSFKELETIVSEFEKGNLDLDESLIKFEQGLQLAGELKKRLNEVENKIVEIKKKMRSDSEGVEE